VRYCPSSHSPILDPDPNHIWNRLYASLWIRHGADGIEYGADALDPPLWTGTQHLLTGDSHRTAIACLDEFLDTHAERVIEDPLRRVLLQRALWEVFDWAAIDDEPSPPREALESRLAKVILRLALTPRQIRALPATYAAASASGEFNPSFDPQYPHQPFLPPDLPHPHGPWVCLSAFSRDPTVLGHFTGRSRFLAFIRLPEGRDATLAYVNSLRSQPPLIVKPVSVPLLNLALPQFPAGTQVALLRQLIAIDTEGNLVPTRLSESLQLRVYRAIAPQRPYMNDSDQSPNQDFFEFRLSIRRLLANRTGGLRAIGPAETEFATFSTYGIDAFESVNPLETQGVILARCRACHRDSGIHSVQSRMQWMQHASGDPSGGDQADCIGWETKVTIARKQEEHDFKLLNTLARQP
jgi:hypothetical protein